ncbi:DUF2125 domain-containing protein [Pararhizobium haloflavum]|uniref:DUF2125 domain-containing protein n=1 Tax=Pararhizobium haloflavum TaxID=2037914 RepID=UPI00130014A1|nr:DUF2125 domain-containing protein [Pararhizobium haloflavum]
MVRSSTDGRRKPSTKLVGLAIFILAAILCYSAVWYYLADQLKGRVQGLIADLAAEEVVASCDDLEVRGYPFRLGVFCSRVTADGAQEGSVSAASFRSAAQIYRPGHIVSELDGPMEVSRPDGENVTADWSSLRASTVFGTSGLQRASIEGRDVDAAINSPDIGSVGFDASTLEMHGRANGPDLDFAIRTTGAILENPALPVDLPQLDLVGEAQITNGRDFLSGRAIEVEALRGASGRLTNVSVVLDGGASLRLSGPFAFTESGLLSGEFDVAIDQLEIWTTTLSELLPGARSMVRTAGGLMQSMGDGESLSVTLQVREGRVAFGIIPIGEIPPI